MSGRTASQSNRLLDCTSPYLQQHAYNPVDWHPWEDKALTRARSENKPILLSIGYSACHWCHVMERESFSDTAIAAMMNADFICIKVDREERPDLDETYMAATMALNGGKGGWPMTVFLTPDLKPFFAGTYFPPEDRHGMPGFKTLLAKVAQAWSREKGALARHAQEITRQLQEGARPRARRMLGEPEVGRALRKWQQTFDPRWGGFSPAPKFPSGSIIDFLLQVHHRYEDADALKMATTTLDGMAAGGIYDHIGGGFSRYSTDDRWHVPHFEKMLYDNAQLARVYLTAFQITGRERYREVGRGTLEFVQREMTSEGGGFFSSFDADSEGEEGKYYVWRPPEVADILGSDAAEVFCGYYDIQESGNWGDVSVLRAPETPEVFAARVGWEVDVLTARLAQWRESLRIAREGRPKPALDDKVVTAWNGLMISAMAEGYRVLGEARWLDAATDAVRFLRERLVDPRGHLLRVYRAGRAHTVGFLEDHAFVIQALLDLYDVSGDIDSLQWADRLADTMLGRFGDRTSGAFSTAAPDEAPLMTRVEGHDGALPAANAVAARCLQRLAWHTGDTERQTAALRAIQAVGAPMSEMPQGFAATLGVLDGLLAGPVQVVLIGTPDDPRSKALRGAVQSVYLPHCAVVHSAPDTVDLDGLHRLLLQGKDGDDTPRGYVCYGGRCLPPTSEPAALVELLRQACGEAPRAHSVTPVVAGRATPVATRQAALSGRRLGRSELWVSPVGFGGYRVDHRVDAHVDALEHALEQGCNVIDTSANYTDGNSERLVGEVLSRDPFVDRRNGLVVISKIGYVQGENLLRAREREAQGTPFSEMVHYSDDCWHCIHPDYLEEQLARCLERLRLATLDVLLLHNPEYFLGVSDVAPNDLAAHRDEFYRRIESAFSFLERQVEAGVISFYGVSSNTLVLPSDDPRSVCLHRLWHAAGRAAERVGASEPRFAVVQMPLNLLEPGALEVANPGPDGNETVLEAAKRYDLGVLTNRPLNAVIEDSIVRLADTDAPRSQRPLAEAVWAVRTVERTLSEQLTGHVAVGSRTVALSSLFQWGDELERFAEAVHGWEQWREISALFIEPQLQQVLRLLDSGLPEQLAQKWLRLRPQYVEALRALVAGVGVLAAGRSRARYVRIRDAVDGNLPPQRRDEALSRKALWTVMSTPGVTAALCGMRTVDYVDDALGPCLWMSLPDPQAVYRAVGDAFVL